MMGCVNCFQPKGNYNPHPFLREALNCFESKLTSGERLTSRRERGKYHGFPRTVIMIIHSEFGRHDPNTTGIIRDEIVLRFSEAGEWNEAM
jgi:hypothetical protein